MGSVREERDAAWVFCHIQVEAQTKESSKKHQPICFIRIPVCNAQNRVSVAQAGYYFLVADQVWVAPISKALALPSMASPLTVPVIS